MGFRSIISLNVNEGIYLKDPVSSDLGKKILTGAIDMIERDGFEHFTFRKLGKEIKSTEASVYRYFECKHNLLAYLTSWYWSWMEYRLEFAIANIEDPKEQLNRGLFCITKEITQDSDFLFIDEVKLFRIVVAESSKVFLNKEVDTNNKSGFFREYKSFVQRMSELVLAVNDKFKYPHMLISTVIGGVHHQRFFAEHLPGLTDVIKGEDSVDVFYHQMVFNSIEK